MSCCIPCFRLSYPGGLSSVVGWALAGLFLFAATAHAEIRIGVAGPMGGQNGAFGQQMKAGAEAAVAAINAGGGVNGELLTLDIVDDACDTRRALGVAQDFAARDVRMVAGHFCSGATIAAAKTYEDAGILTISPSSSHPSVTEQGRWNILRMAGRDDVQADMAADRIALDYPGARIGLISDGQNATRAVASRFKARVPAAEEIAIKPGSTDFSDITAAISARGLDTLYLAISPADAGSLVAALDAAGIPVRLYGSDLLLAEVYWDKAKEAAQNTLVTFAIDPMALANPARIATQFRAKGINPEGAALPVYAAIETFVAAARARDVNNGRAMADWLKGGNRIETIVGPVTFDAKGDVQERRFTWYRWSNGQYAEDTGKN